MVRSVHTRFVDLNTAGKSGSTSLTPPENGAGECSVPKKCQHFLGKTGFPSGASYFSFLADLTCTEFNVFRGPYMY